MTNEPKLCAHFVHIFDLVIEVIEIQKYTQELAEEGALKQTNNKKKQSKNLVTWF